MPSEDPFHSGQYGVAYTKGLQWGNDTRYTKAIGALKHYTIYSVENSGGHGDVRGSDYFEIAMRDIEETYLPQFKAPVVEAKSLGYMCSYAALTSPSLDSDSASHPHSEPCCASKFFAITKMQEEYGFEGYVQSDCGAVSNEIHGEKYAANATDAAAKAIVDGHMNSCCGGGLQGNACAAIESGEMKQQDLVDRVTRSFTLLMDAGLFDPLEQQQYTKIPFDTINSESSQASMLEVRKRSSFFFHFFYAQNDHFYQDRLGTNVGKSHQQSDRFLAGGASVAGSAQERQRKGDPAAEERREARADRAAHADAEGPRWQLL